MGLASSPGINPAPLFFILKIPSAFLINSVAIFSLSVNVASSDSVIPLLSNSCLLRNIIPLASLTSSNLCLFSILIKSFCVCACACAFLMTPASASALALVILAASLICAVAIADPTGPLRVLPRISLIGLNGLAAALRLLTARLVLGPLLMITAISYPPLSLHY